MKQDIKNLKERLEYFEDLGWKTLSEQEFHDLIFHGFQAKRFHKSDLILFGLPSLLIIFFFLIVG